MPYTEEDLGLLLRALNFAAEQHVGQRRKGKSTPPYINHPIRVTDLLWRVGGVREVTTLVAALLHDVVEDTGVAAEAIEAAFGPEVRAIVMEVTDDKSLPKAERKRLQVEHAPHLSAPAQLIKLADKIDNVHDVSHDPPPPWPPARRVGYLDWAERVVDGLRGVNPALEARFDAELHEARRRLRQDEAPGSEHIRCNAPEPKEK
jgi:guanosine-3',5'-bis(diphosphate) 3'-pyrophosphohydrolase